jgi:hypothetical protein
MKTKIVFLITLCAIVSSQALEPLQEALPGARLLYKNPDNSRIYYHEIGTSGSKQVTDNSVGHAQVKWINTGDKILYGGPDRRLTIVDLDGNVLFSYQLNGDINMKVSRDHQYSFDPSYDGKKIYYVSGNTISVLDIETRHVSDVFELNSDNRIREGEFCVSADGNRFVGRYSNSKSIYVDVKMNSQGSYGSDCSPCISPSGTVCATNTGSPMHANMIVYTWPLTQRSPRESHRAQINSGQWDNHTWSNHEAICVGANNGLKPRVIDVMIETGGGQYRRNWIVQDVPDNIWYPDFWVPEEIGGVVLKDRETGYRRRDYLHVVSGQAVTNRLQVISSKRTYTAHTHSRGIVSLDGRTRIRRGITSTSVQEAGAGIVRDREIDRDTFLKP